MQLMRLPIRRLDDEILALDGDVPYDVTNPEDIPPGAEDGIFSVEPGLGRARFESKGRDNTSLMDVSVIMNPEAHGLAECPHCHGYGSSLKEDADRCTYCGGKGLVPKDKAENYRG